MTGNNKKIGLIADSHSNNTLLYDAIIKLKELGVDAIVHLGDICDSMKYEALDAAVEILGKHDVRAVKGNNECYILTELNYNKPFDLLDSTISYINNLPYNFFIDDICFTHSLPFSWLAATRYPLKEYIPMFAAEKNPAFRIMFRGHSHTSSVVEMKNNEFREFHMEPGQKINMQRDTRYIITVGAVEDGLCAFYDFGTNEFSLLHI